MSRMKICLQLFVLFLSLTIVECQEWVNEMRAFVDDNGLKYVTFLENSTLPSPYLKNILLAASQRADFYLRTSRIEDYTERNQIFDLDVQIFLFNPEYDVLGYFLRVIQYTKVGRSILIFTKPWQGTEDVLHDHLLDTQNLFFYIASPSNKNLEGSVLSWQKVLTLRSGYTIDELKFEESSYSIVEDFNLNGLKIESISLTWDPFLTIAECDEHGTNCAKHFGYLVDYMDALANVLNFTYKGYKDLGKHIMEFFASA